MRGGSGAAQRRGIHAAYHCGQRRSAGGVQSVSSTRARCEPLHRSPSPPSSYPPRLLLRAAPRLCTLLPVCLGLCFPSGLADMCMPSNKAEPRWRSTSTRGVARSVGGSITLEGDVFSRVRTFITCVRVYFLHCIQVWHGLRLPTSEDNTAHLAHSIIYILTTYRS